MKNNAIQFFLAVTLCAGAFSVCAQSFGSGANATQDIAGNTVEQTVVPSNILAIFDKAKRAVDNDNKLNLCGFYTGMSNADAQALAGFYNLKPGEWSVVGDPVFKIWFTLKGVRRVTKGGNTYDELAQAVANRVGSLKMDWETDEHMLKTIDGIVVRMSESSGFNMVDPFERERPAREAERRAREQKEASERRAREQRAASEQRARTIFLTWKTESKTVSISPDITIELQSIPGPLWFGKTEVTQSQWEAVMGNNPSDSKENDNPVEQVSWDDCQIFLNKLNALPATKEAGLTFRLPTKKEWADACRAGASGEYCRLGDGTEISKDLLAKVAWFEDNSGRKVHSVGQKTPNAFGLYDMLGNVWEWTQTAEFGDVRVRCGGCYLSAAGGCAASTQNRYSPSRRNSYLGLRLCADGNAD